MNNQVVFITGSTRGIGRAIALKYASMGCSVIINGVRSEDALRSLEEEIKAYGVKVLSFLGDLSDYDTARRCFDMIYSHFPKVDILINNAGISYVGLFTDMKPEEMKHVIDTNLMSTMNCCHLCVPHMVHEKSGEIIQISSVWGVTGASCEVAYSASKGALNTFTKALAKELAPSNIHVNAIACGMIDTDMNACFSAEDKDAIAEEIPAGRIASPNEVAEFVYKLTDHNTYMTAQVINFDGGWI
ncbi:MAG: SDR family NAD(P)-dependent oxidoreductase [Lachnospiraceae bacterium]|nr:SDR family NAD(P)-dependent oxidoreductase [Lachnospiraceae bacterium]